MSRPCEPINLQPIRQQFVPQDGQNALCDSFTIWLNQNSCVATHLRESPTPCGNNGRPTHHSLERGKSETLVSGWNYHSSGPAHQGCYPRTGERTDYAHCGDRLKCLFPTLIFRSSKNEIDIGTFGRYLCPSRSQSRQVLPLGSTSSVDYEQRSDPEILQLRISSGDRLLILARYSVRNNVDALGIDSEQFEYFVGCESAGGDYG